MNEKIAGHELLDPPMRPSPHPEPQQLSENQFVSAILVGSKRDIILV
jgi:hypothetical protein